MSKVLSILIIPAVIIIGSLRYYLFYRHAINRHLNDENYRERTHNPAPIYILLGITILALLFSNSRNQLAINNLQNNILQLSNQIYQLDQKLIDISKKDLAVYSYGLDLISLEKQNGQYVATVRVNVYPELLHGKTEFTLKYNGESQVMKEENGRVTNCRNAAIPVYGRAYAVLKDGTYLFGVTRCRSLQEQVELADAQWLSLSHGEQEALKALYESFRSEMGGWDIPNLKASGK